jgi:hypothetical protein
MVSRQVVPAILLAGALASALRGGELELHGFGSVRGIGVSGQAPWIEGGFGRLTEGADASGDSTFTGRAKLHAGLDWRPSDQFFLHVHGLARAEPSAAGGDRFGVPEAYAVFRPELSATVSLQLKAGLFFPGTSLENRDRLWASPYSITFSALNSWLAEELRLTGLEGRLLWSDGRDTLHAGGTGFVANDTLGTLVAWRGWSFGDRFTVIGERLPVPPLASLRPSGVFSVQRSDGTRPIGELDHRVGWMVRGGWERRDRFVLQAAYLDNRGDRNLYAGEYAWDTRFWVFGARLEPGAGITLLGEAMLGNTTMGPRAGAPGGGPYRSPYDPGADGGGYPAGPATGAAFVDTDFATAYAMLSWQRSAVRLSARFDWFRNKDRDGVAEDDGEHGKAFTLAAFWTPVEHLRLGAELLGVYADRPAAGQSWADPDTDAWKATLEARVLF